MEQEHKQQFFRLDYTGLNIVEVTISNTGKHIGYDFMINHTRNIPRKHIAIS